jgi:AraC-like DNA-binding protein
MAIRLTERRIHGLRLTHAIADYADFVPHRGESDEQVVRMHFSLRGRYGVDYPQLERRYEHLGPHFSVFFACPFALEFQNETPLIETFGIGIPVSQFASYAEGANDDVSRFCERATSGRASFLYEPSSTLPIALEWGVRRMLESRYEGTLEELYLLSQSIELLVRVIGAGARSDAIVRGFVPTKRDREKLVAARDFVNSHLTDPPVLGELARQVGLNEYKLKRGFKELFGTTVFAYLTAERLELARRMLLDTDKSAAEIAAELGYATPQHFHAAFKKRFAVSPNSVRKNPA